MNLIVRTLSDRVFEIVREQIVTGALPTLQPIRQDALASALGVSKIPLREALARLEQEGLLSSQANRGYFVRPMSTAEVEEIFSMRLKIEPAAAGHACTVATAADKDAAQKAFDDLDNTFAKTDRLFELTVKNRDFHMALVLPGDRLLTTQMVDRLQVLAERYVLAHLKPVGREDRAHREHRALLTAWLAGDSEGFTQLLAQHIQATLDDLRLQLSPPTA